MSVIAQWRCINMNGFTREKKEQRNGDEAKVKSKLKFASNLLDYVFCTLFNDCNCSSIQWNWIIKHEFIVYVEQLCL